MFLWLRRAYQLIFFLLFMFLVFMTTARFIGGYPVHWFLGFDPLIAVSTALASHSLHHHLLWALPLIVLTMVFGRFFCGWMCPMGAMHQLIGWFARPRKKRARMHSNRVRPAQKIKYLILAAMLGMSALGSVQVGLLDPIASTWRGMTMTVFPGVTNHGILAVYQGERHFEWGVLVLLVFFGALALNLIFQRFFCRILCPLGAFLGVLSKRSLFRIRRDESACTSCGACGADCQGAADPAGNIRVSECMVCLNCTTSCPKDSIRYGLATSPDPNAAPVDVGRRRWVTAAVGGAAAVPLMRTSAAFEPRPSPKLIRPPGALAEAEFLERCVKCGACIKVCPTGGLQPALDEAGFEGLWSPVLVPRIGNCEQECVLCSQVCPTGAIRKIDITEKIGAPPEIEPVRIGSARFDKGRCLPWAYDRQCIVCEEVCPTSPKAIYFKLVTVILRDGSEETLKRPYIDLDLCTGCGTCESRCPVFDSAGVRVTSVGESRSTKNRLIISGGQL